MVAARGLVFFSMARTRYRLRVGKRGQAMGDKISQLIRMLDQLPEAQSRALLEKIFREDPLTAVRIIQRHFDFPDLRYANTEGLALLLEAVGESRMVTALQGAEDALIRRVADTLGTRKAMTFIADVDALAAPEHLVTAARRAVLVKAMLLRRQGRLSLRRPGVDGQGRS